MKRDYPHWFIPQCYEKDFAPLILKGIAFGIGDRIIQLKGLNVSEEQFERAVVDMICRDHEEDTSKKNISSTWFDTCKAESSGLFPGVTKPGCILDEIQAQNITPYSVEFNGSAVFPSRNEMGDPTSYACMDVVLRLDYVLLPIGFQRFIYPTKLSVVEGNNEHCEAAHLQLALQALILSLEGEWSVSQNISTDPRSIETARMGKVQRYQALMMASSRLSQNRGKGSDFVNTNNSGPECMFREIMPTTVVPIDYPFIILVVEAVLCGLIIIYTAIVKLKLDKSSWHIESYVHSLSSLIAQKECNLNLNAHYSDPITKEGRHLPRKRLHSKRRWTCVESFIHCRGA